LNNGNENLRFAKRKSVFLKIIIKKREKIQMLRYAEREEAHFIPNTIQHKMIKDYVTRFPNPNPHPHREKLYACARNKNRNPLPPFPSFHLINKLHHLFI